MAKKVKLSPGKKEEIKGTMMKFRIEAEDGNKSDFIRMTENERFKIGKHWNYDDLSFNEAHGKFSLTINEVLPIVLDIAGTQEENPLDYKIRNVKGGTQVIAEILTSLTKNVMDKSMGRSEASQSFESGITTGRGFLFIDIDYTNDPLNGDLVIKELDPFMVLPDPTCKEYDYNKEKGGAKYIIIDEWEDKGKVEAKYPGLKEDIKSATFDPAPQGRFGAIMSSIFGGTGPNLHLKDDYRHHDERTFKEEMESNVSKQTNNYRRSTYLWKEWKKGAYVQKLDDPLNYLAITDPKDIKAAKEFAELDPNIRVIEKDQFENQLTVPVLNRTVMYGDVLVEHIEDPFDGMNLYPLIRFAPYFDHGYEYPPVQNLIGPQKLINYTFSSLVNILKNLANSGWKVGKGTQRQLQWLEEHGGEDGLVLNLSKYGFAEKITTTEYPTGFDIITERGKQNMREISQVQLTVPKTGRPESGKAKQIDEIRTQRTKGIIFRNWNHTHILVGRVLIEMVRKNYNLPHGILCLAGSGKKFHGFKNRAWISMPGNIHLSVFFAPGKQIRNFSSGFMILAAVSVLQTLDTIPTLQKKSMIKWVNDIFIEDAKVCRVIAHTLTQGKIVSGVVLGIGLNVEVSPVVEPTVFVPKISSLQDIVPNEIKIDSKTIYAQLIKNLQKNYSVLISGNYNKLIEFYKLRSLVIGKDVKILTDNLKTKSEIIASGRVVSIGENLELFFENRSTPVTKGRLVI